MSTIEDFKKAPVGATATHGDGSIALKPARRGFEWSKFDSHGDYIDSLSSDEMRGFTLNLPAPATAREALDLAWDLAHPVEPGQVIPKGTRFLDRHDSWMMERTAQIDIRISPEFAPVFRTLEPLPDTDPEPDWLDASVVLATRCWCTRGIWLPETGGYWKCARCRVDRHWSDLRDVTPLYPKGQKA